MLKNVKFKDIIRIIVPIIFTKDGDGLKEYYLHIYAASILVLTVMAGIGAAFGMPNPGLVFFLTLSILSAAALYYIVRQSRLLEERLAKIAENEKIQNNLRISLEELKKYNDIIEQELQEAKEKLELL